MAVTKLRADAPPFHSRCRPLQFPPPPPPPHCMAACHYHPSVCPPPSPFVPNYQFRPLLVPPPGPIYGSHPPPHPAAVPVRPLLAAFPPRPRRKGPVRFIARFLRSPLPAAKGRPFLRKANASPPSKTPPATLSSKEYVPSPPPPTSRAPLSSKDAPAPPLPASRAPLSSKDAPSPPPPTSRAPLRPMVALPHGAAPHKHICKHIFVVGEDVDGEKLRAQAAAANMARAAESVNPGKEAPPPAAASRPGKRMSQPRLLRRPQQGTERARGKVVGPRLAKVPVKRACRPVARSPSPARGKVVGPRLAKVPVKRHCKPVARSPSPVFTTRPPRPMPPPEWHRGRVTTVMIRNVPNRLKPCEMMQLLDEHCARANSKKKKPVPVAYDFLYLPMDFSKSSSNMGYAFVNLTTAEAAGGLHYALHGARWKVHGTKKVIDIRAARIQGKDALVSHFSGSTFPCHTDEHLPAAFSPPRDGSGATSTITYVGKRVHTPVPPPRPLPVAPAPQQLVWRPVAVGGVVAPGSS
ncbi:unnamed protein product [Alopecurus aequalis]